MEVCFDCPQRFTSAEAADQHWALRGHLVGDPDAAQEWLDHVAGASAMTGAPLQPDERRAA